MRVATCTLSSKAPYGQGKYHDTPKLGRKESGTATESHIDYERRTWRERCHYDEHGQVYIPPMAFKNCLSEIAKYLSVQIPGKGKSTYTKHFEAGVMVFDRVPLGVTKDEIEGEKLFVPASGRRGDGKRVQKIFPVVQSWTGTVQFHIIDDVISEDIFAQHLVDAGNFIGIGRFRPRNNGYYGRFSVDKIEWSA